MAHLGTLRPSHPRSARIRLAAVAAVSVALVLALFFFWQRGIGDDRQLSSVTEALAEPKVWTLAAADVRRVETFCSDCHALPRPASFPRHAWHDFVLRGYEFYARSGRTDLDPPPPDVTAAYYRARAPETLAFPPLPADSEKPFGATFEPQRIPGSTLAPAIAHLKWLSLPQAARPMLVSCDMRGGDVTAIDLEEGETLRLARLDHPCHVEACDLDADGLGDLVVADLGSATPDDHDRGRVVWLRGVNSKKLVFEPRVVAAGLGRVADVRPSDVDGDGDLDLLVAEFGLHRTGGIHLLRNLRSHEGIPRFELETIDSRPGTIHIPLHDLNGDGLPDFVALISQEYESVELFLNQGEGRFRSQRLWSAPDLTFGSSGLELVDLDGDGDMDILYSNGDTFDNAYANPTHGVQWLENKGELRFVYHRITDMTGAFRAVAGDLDGDRDADMIVVAQLPSETQPFHLGAEPQPAILILEQTEPGEFVRHTLERGRPLYANVELADFDGDGDLDFATGSVGGHWVTRWDNDSPGER